MEESPNTEYIEHKIREWGDERAIIVKPIEALKGYKGNAIAAVVETREEIRIYIDFKYSTDQIEASYVHELLHVLCTLEGFPNVILNQRYKKIISPDNWGLAEGLRDDLWTAIQHPYVFIKVINEYDLNLDIYFDDMVYQKILRFNKRETETSDFQLRFLAQQDILIGLEYFSYPEKHQKQIMKIYEELNPASFNACIELYEKLSFDTPKNTFKSGNIMLDFLKEYGRDTDIARVNTFWNLLKVTYEKPHLLYT